MANDILFSDGNEIIISRGRAVFGNKMYVISSITSIELRHEKILINSEQRNIPFLAIIAGGVIGMILGLGLMWFAPSMGIDTTGVVFWVVAGGIFGAAVGAKNAPTKHQDQYTIVITSTSGEIEALTTADKAQADAVVRALDQAIGDQSRNF